MRTQLGSSLKDDVSVRRNPAVAERAVAPHSQAPKTLPNALAVWHESLVSARHDELIALSVDGGQIRTARPLEEGTPVFLELALGRNSNAPRAEIDAVVVDNTRGEPGFAVRFLKLDDAVRVWIEHYLVGLPAAAPAPTPSPPDIAEASPPRTPPPLPAEASVSTPVAPAPFTQPPGALAPPPVEIDEAASGLAEGPPPDADGFPMSWSDSGDVSAAPSNQNATAPWDEASDEAQDSDIPPEFESDEHDVVDSDFAEPTLNVSGDALNEARAFLAEAVGDDDDAADDADARPDGAAEVAAPIAPPDDPFEFDAPNHASLEVDAPNHESFEVVDDDDPFAALDAAVAATTAENALDALAPQDVVPAPPELKPEPAPALAAPPETPPPLPRATPLPDLSALAPPSRTALPPPRSPSLPTTPPSGAIEDLPLANITPALVESPFGSLHAGAAAPLPPIVAAHATTSVGAAPQASARRSVTPTWQERIEVAPVPTTETARVDPAPPETDATDEAPALGGLLSKDQGPIALPGPPRRAHIDLQSMEAEDGDVRALEVVEQGPESGAFNTSPMELFAEEPAIEGDVSLAAFDDDSGVMARASGPPPEPIAPAYPDTPRGVLSDEGESEEAVEIDDFDVIDGAATGFSGSAPAPVSTPPALPLMSEDAGYDDDDDALTIEFDVEEQDDGPPLSRPSRVQTVEGGSVRTLDDESSLGGPPAFDFSAEAHTQDARPPVRPEDEDREADELATVDFGPPASLGLEPSDNPEPGMLLVAEGVGTDVFELEVDFDDAMTLEPDSVPAHPAEVPNIRPPPAGPSLIGMPPDPAGVVMRMPHQSAPHLLDEPAPTDTLPFGLSLSDVQAAVSHEKAARDVGPSLVSRDGDPVGAATPATRSSTDLFFESVVPEPEAGHPPSLEQVMPGETLPFGITLDAIQQSLSDAVRTPRSPDDGKSPFARAPSGPSPRVPASAAPPSAASGWTATGPITPSPTLAPVAGGPADASFLSPLPPTLLPENAAPTDGDLWTVQPLNPDEDDDIPVVVGAVEDGGEVMDLAPEAVTPLAPTPPAASGLAHLFDETEG